MRIKARLLTGIGGITLCLGAANAQTMHIGARF
jgi:hypothetical protein